MDNITSPIEAVGAKRIWSWFIPRTPLQWLYACGIAYALFMCCFSPYKLGDTWTYYDAWHTLLTGKLDLYRTPVYPVFVGVIESIMKESKYSFAVSQLLQYAAGLYVFKYFYRLCNAIVLNRTVATVLCFIYIATPFVAGLSSTILTESFSVMGSVLVFYIIYQLMTGNDKYKYYVALAVLTLFLVFLRPSFIFLFIALPMAAALMWRKYRRSAVALLVCTLVGVITFAGYCMAIKAEYGVFTVSKVSDYNRFAMMMQYEDDLKLEKTSELYPVIAYDMLTIYEEARKDPNYSQNINSHTNLQYEMLLSKYGFRDVHNALWIAIAENRSKDVHKLLHRLLDMQNARLFLVTSNIFGLFGEDMRPIINLLSPSFKALLLLILTYTVYLGYSLLKRKPLMIYDLFLYIMVVGIYGVAIFGAQDSWARLTVAANPLLLIMAGQLFCVVGYHLFTKNKTN